jgi:hypothetical protein
LAITLGQFTYHELDQHLVSLMLVPLATPEQIRSAFDDSESDEPNEREVFALQSPENVALPCGWSLQPID